MKIPSVHVILATYNPGAHFRAQLRSILEQAQISVRVTVFDDGSTNKTYLLETPELLDPRVSLLECVASGSAGKNFLRAITLLKDSDADWVCLSDQDDIWLEQKIIQAVITARKADAHGYSSNLTLYNGEVAYGVLEKPSTQTPYDYCFQGASAGCTYLMSNPLFKKVQESVEHLDLESLTPQISHDWLIYFIARAFEFTWFHDERSFILYRQHSNNVYGAKRGIRGMISRISLLKDGLATDNTSCLNSICLISNICPEPLNRNTIFSRIFFFRNMFSLRRDKISSAIVFFMWIAGIYYPFKSGPSVYARRRAAR